MEIVKMPVKESKDKLGCFYQWSSHGKRYYFKSSNPISAGLAKYKAKKQGRAIKANKR